MGDDCPSRASGSCAGRLPVHADPGAYACTDTHGNPYAHARTDTHGNPYAHARTDTHAYTHADASGSATSGACSCKSHGYGSDADPGVYARTDAHANPDTDGNPYACCHPNCHAPACYA